MKELYNKIQEWFSRIRKDDHLHFEFTTSISFVTSKIIQYAFGGDVPVAATVGALTAFGVGIFKELCIDYVWRHTEFDWKDIRANVVGSVTGAIMSLV